MKRREMHKKRGSDKRHTHSCEHTATHCNSLQPTATHCNPLQPIATHCNTPQHKRHTHSCAHTLKSWLSPSHFLQLCTDTQARRHMNTQTREHKNTPIYDLLPDHLRKRAIFRRCITLPHERSDNRSSLRIVAATHQYLLVDFHLQCVATSGESRLMNIFACGCYSSPMLQCSAVCCSVLQCVAVCCSVLQRVAVCCSVLQCVAVC